ncbi:site-specific integrase [Glutamicibacter sp. BSL13]
MTNTDAFVGWRLRSARPLKPETISNWLPKDFHNLAQREEEVGLRHDEFFLLKPDGFPDPSVSAYLHDRSFRRLSRATQESYVKDLRTHFNFLSSQNLDWRECTVEVFEDYEYWRRRDDRNPARISGAKFRRELAACRRFYEWQARSGIISASPIETFTDDSADNEQSERLGRTHEIIPDDPSGRISLRRFRRTLAWFIYRQPGGRVALGVQYGHLHSYTTDGYGSRVSAGLRDLFPLEEALSVSDGLARAMDAADGKSHVSGPAAQRYKLAVDEYRAVYGGKVMNAKQAASLMRNPALRIYDNGPQILACCYDPAKALCHPDRKVNKGVGQSPDATACDSRCANIARTDEHISRIQQMIDESKVESESEIAPLPLRERSKQRVQALEALVDSHKENGVEL